MTNASPPEVGDVLSFWYLWRREFEAGEESGRKARPCVVVVAVVRGPKVTRVAVAPITHAPPSSEQVAVELPSIVKAHLKLDARSSWVVCNELNEFNGPVTILPNLPDVSYWVDCLIAYSNGCVTAWARPCGAGN